MAFEGFAQSLPQFITAFMAPDTDTGQAFAYYWFKQNSGFIISITGILLMLLIGSLYSKYLLQLAPSNSITDNAGFKIRLSFQDRNTRFTYWYHLNNSFPDNAMGKSFSAIFRHITFNSYGVCQCMEPKATTNSKQ
jgi:hypothetical protein